jgi:hypothetical protein
MAGDGLGTSDPTEPLTALFASSWCAQPRSMTRGPLRSWRSNRLHPTSQRTRARSRHGCTASGPDLLARVLKNLKRANMSVLYTRDHGWEAACRAVARVESEGVALDATAFVIGAVQTITY